MVYPVATDTPELIDAHRKKFNYYDWFVRDEKHRLVKEDRYHGDAGGTLMTEWPLLHRRPHRRSLTPGLRPRIAAPRLRDLD